MAMMVHTNGQRHLKIAAQAHLSAITRFVRGAVAVFAVAAAVTAVLAAKTACFLSHLDY